MAHLNVLKCPVLAKVILLKVENLLTEYFPRIVCEMVDYHCGC